MTREEWLRTGIDAGYCTTIFCDNHDGWAAEDTELAKTLWDEYEGDHCQHVVRIKNRDEAPPAPTRLVDIPELRVVAP